MIEIVPIETIEDVLENILINGSKKERLIKKMREISGAVTSKVSTDAVGLSNPSHN
jgi:Lon-like ATP-dependent protease